MNKKWELVKSQAKAEGKADDWSYITQLYRQIGGLEQSIELVVDCKKQALVGQTHLGKALVMSTTGELLELTDKQYKTSKKLFKSSGFKDLSKLIPVKKWINRSDGSGYMGTVYVSPEEAKVIETSKKVDDTISESTSKATDDGINWREKTAELQADIAVMWQLQCKNLYSSANLGALAVRESVQNSRDAINDAIKQGLISRGKIDISWSGNSLTMEDNGTGMDVKTLHTKFLNLGGTTKGESAGQSVGGFGVAKAVILGCGDTFEIQTRDNYLDSNNLGVGTIQQTKDPIQGTKITINNVAVGKDRRTESTAKISDREGDFRNSILDYLATSEVDDIDIYIQGEKITPKFVKSIDTLKQLTDFNVSSDVLPDGCDVEVNVFKIPEDSFESGYLYVRLGGLTQFKTYLGGELHSNIVLDFSVGVDPRSDKYPFASSRETLKTKYQGIVDAIRDTVSQNPLAISSQDKYKETVFDNKTLKAKEDRKIMRSSIDLGTMISDVLKMNRTASYKPDKSDNTTDSSSYDASNGMDAQGQYDAPSLADRLSQQQEFVVKQAKKYDLTPEEFIDKMQTVSDADSNLAEDDDNPMDYSWLVWENKDREDAFDVGKNLEILVAWDSILRKVAQSSSQQVSEFYPGFILEERTLGMSVNKSVPTKNGTEQRKFVMINPEEIPTKDDISTALYLRDIACHELAHAMIGNFDGHGETHSYTREMLGTRSILSLQDMITIVKDTKIRKKIDALKKDHIKMLNKKQEAENMKEFMEPVIKAEEEFDKLEHSDSFRELLYWKMLENDNNFAMTDIMADDVVYVVSRNNPTLFGERGEVMSVNKDKDEVTVKTFHNRQVTTMKLNQVYQERKFDSLYNRMSGGVYDSPHVNEYDNWIYDHSELGLLSLLSKYLPSYKMRKFNSMDTNQRLKSLSNHLEGIVDKHLSMSHSSKIANKEPIVLSESDKETYLSEIIYAYRELMRDCDSDYYYSDDCRFIAQSDSSKAIINGIIDKTLKKYNKLSSPTKTSGTKKAKDTTQTPEESKVLNDLKGMSNSELFAYADKLDILGLDNYANEGIKRMRATMAIKKKLLNKSMNKEG